MSDPQVVGNGVSGVLSDCGVQMIPNMLQLLCCSTCSIATDLAQWRKYPPPAFPILENGPSGLNGPMEPAYFSSYELEGWALLAQWRRKCVAFLIPFPTDDLFCSLSLGSALQPLFLFFGLYMSPFYLGRQSNFFEIKPLLCCKWPWDIQCYHFPAVLMTPNSISKFLKAFPGPPCVHLPSFKCPMRQLLWDPGTHFSVSLT